MVKQIKANSEKQHPTPQGYEKYPIGGRGLFLYLSTREARQTKDKQDYARWYYEVGKWVRRNFEALGRFLERYSTAAILLVTAVNAVVAYYQWEAMREDVRVATDNLDLTRKMIRADLVISGIGFVQAGGPVPQNDVAVAVKNTGDTKATHVGGDWMSWVCDGPPSQACLNQCPFLRSASSVIGLPSATIGKGEEQPMEVRSSVKTPEQAEAIRRGEKTLYVCGIVGYQDMSESHHDILPCAYYRPTRGDFMRCFGSAQEY